MASSASLSMPAAPSKRLRTKSTLASDIGGAMLRKAAEGADVMVGLQQVRGARVKPADQIRNVALVGHRGSGKTSTFEALLFEAGAINRLGSGGEGSTGSDSPPHRKARGMSVAGSLAPLPGGEPQGNLIRTPGRAAVVAHA